MISAWGMGARSTSWNQIKANVLNVPYRRLNRSEFGTWGSALVAGKAVGLFDDLAARAEETTQTTGDPIQPDASLQRLYTPLIEQYIRMQSDLSAYFDTSSTLNLEAVS